MVNVLCTISVYVPLSLHRYEPRTLYEQQRIQAAASHTRCPYPEDEVPDHLDNRYIVQRQMDGEYDSHTSAYYSRAPEMQMEEVEAGMNKLPAGMVGRDGERGAVGVGPSLAERKTGLDGMRWRSQQQWERAATPPSMYESSSRIPELDDSDF